MTEEEGKNLCTVCKAHVPEDRLVVIPEKHIEICRVCCVEKEHARKNTISCVVTQLPLLSVEQDMNGGHHWETHILPERKVCASCLGRLFRQYALQKKACLQEEETEAS